ncbi:MAG: LUD domain-containing protein [Hymenobacteraceae bacterium]|nr:LUD domain-containing protein [Hymenobacteraceae bacterium]
MYETRSKDLILRRIREGLAKGGAALPPTPDLTAQVHPPLPADLVEAFAQNFIAAGGTFVYCEGDEHFFEELYRFKQQHKLDTLHVWEPGLQEYLAHGEIAFTAAPEHFVADAPAALTTCEALLARTGSVLVSSATASGRRLSIYPEIHLVVAHTTQVVADIPPALEQVQGRYGRRLPSMLSLVTGPSRTADIEKTLVLGAHGPRQLVVFLLDDEHHAGAGTPSSIDSADAPA